MKRYTEQQLWAFVNRANTREKVATAEAWLRRYASKVDMEIPLYDDLMNTLAYISRELYLEAR